MNTLQDYRENAKINGVCERSIDWDSCKNKKQLIDLCLTSFGAHYTCNAIAKGWGIDPIIIERDFSAFINGRFISQQDGYNSELYCRYETDDDIIARSTLIMVVSSNITINISKFDIVYVYVSANSNVVIKGEGQAIINVYGDNTVVNQSLNKKTKIKHKYYDGIRC